MVHIGNNWDSILKEEFEKQYYLDLRKFLVSEYRSQIIHPDMSDIFNALKYTDYEDVKVVILGQDPYHGANQAHGLAFSVKKDVAVPPSLQNIYKELKNDVGFSIPDHGNLTLWAKNGVLLLNTVLTVREGCANSHKGKGWEIFTDHVISTLNLRKSPMVFLLWGNNARQKKKLITNTSHLVLETVHPSPLSAYNGFFGCKHFSRTKSFLNENGSDFDWQL